MNAKGLQPAGLSHCRVRALEIRIRVLLKLNLFELAIFPGSQRRFDVSVMLALLVVFNHVVGQLRKSIRPVKIQ